MGLARHLSGAPAVDPAEAAAWMAAEDGRRFMSMSSEGWCRASIDAGTDEVVARAAAERTTAAYTGAPAT
ncbi:MAG TPA: polyketide cyclase, partial [Pseudonocardiaceae bacterium]|nr:polyketide cyclase [Pseudonocardiaceae bacterium]